MERKENLFTEVYQRRLTTEEINYVASQVHATRNQEGPHLYLWLAALGTAGDTKHRELIESFLYYTSDPEIAELAFSILTRDWGFVADYIKELKQFLKGVDWDKEEKLRKSAVCSAERFLAKNEDQELCSSLITIIEDPNLENSLRQSAYFALPEAMRTGLKYTLRSYEKGKRISSIPFLQSVDELLQEAKWGKLTKEEISYVANRVAESRDTEDAELYLLLAILGEAEAREYKDLVEFFLHYPSNPDISDEAFVVLTGHWDLSGEYLNEMKQFLKGVEWDTWEDIRMSAIKAAGRYLTGYEEKELLETLIRLVEDEKEDEMIRKSAYTALADAMRRDMYTVLTSGYDPSIIADAKQGFREYLNNTSK